MIMKLLVLDKLCLMGAVESERIFSFISIHRAIVKETITNDRPCDM